MLEIKLPYLERLKIDNLDHVLLKPLLYSIIAGEHFPLLKVCQLRYGYVNHFDCGIFRSMPNETLRSLVIDKWKCSDLGSLLHRLPYLHRLEANFEDSYTSITNSIQPHLSLRYMQITLKDPLDDLKFSLQVAPNIEQLRVRGNLEKKEVVGHFKQMAEFLLTLAPRLRQFDCELYSTAVEYHSKEYMIQQVHPLFKRVKCLRGTDGNQCYATDISYYLENNEYRRESFRMFIHSRL